MRQAQSERKQGDAPESAPKDEVTMVVARDLLGELVNKARLLGTRTVLSRNGKRVAAIVPMGDYERLAGAK